MLFMTKIRHANDVIYRIGVVYIENDTKLSWSIGWGTDYDKS